MSPDCTLKTSQTFRPKPLMSKSSGFPRKRFSAFLKFLFVRAARCQFPLFTEFLSRGRCCKTSEWVPRFCLPIESHLIRSGVCQPKRLCNNQAYERNIAGVSSTLRSRVVRFNVTNQSTKDQSTRGHEEPPSSIGLVQVWGKNA